MCLNLDGNKLSIVESPDKHALQKTIGQKIFGALQSADLSNKCQKIFATCAEIGIEIHNISVQLTNLSVEYNRLIEEKENLQQEQ